MATVMIISENATTPMTTRMYLSIVGFDNIHLTASSVLTIPVWLVSCTPIQNSHLAGMLASSGIFSTIGTYAISLAGTSGVLSVIVNHLSASTGALMYPFSTWSGFL